MSSSGPSTKILLWLLTAKRGVGVLRRLPNCMSSQNNASGDPSFLLPMCISGSHSSVHRWSQALHGSLLYLSGPHKSFEKCPPAQSASQRRCLLWLASRSCVEGVGWHTSDQTALRTIYAGWRRRGVELQRLFPHGCVRGHHCWVALVRNV